MECNEDITEKDRNNVYHEKVIDVNIFLVLWLHYNVSLYLTVDFVPSFLFSI